VDSTSPFLPVELLVYNDELLGESFATLAEMSAVKATGLRIGAVSYLNTKPLVWGLRALLPEADLSFDLPSRLGQQLASNALDIALIPTIEYFQNPSYSIVSNACIASRGAVWSVKLFSRVPMADIRTIALDEGSRTSVALLKILLAEQFSLTPQGVPLPMDADPLAINTDAVLLIGDRAMHEPAADWAAVWDLGEVWNRSTGFPFVFAMWTARAGLDPLHLSLAEKALTAARDGGVAHLAEIAQEESESVQLSQAECFHYLHDNLHFTLGTRERAGLHLFRQHAVALQLAPATRVPATVERVTP
jgi:chorismate dehydratase